MTPAADGESVVLVIQQDGYLHLSPETAQRFFPNDSLLVLKRDEELWLLPTRGPAAGGLMLKQRNLRGDRCVLISENLGFAMLEGTFEAHWDATMGALRTRLVSSSPSSPPMPQAEKGSPC